MSSHANNVKKLNALILVAIPALGWATVILSLFAYSHVAAQLWDMFVAEKFRLPTITWATSFGVALLLHTMLRFVGVPIGSFEGERTTYTPRYAPFACILDPMFRIVGAYAVYGVGFLVHFFV